MQSYRLLAAVPLDAKDQKLLDEMGKRHSARNLTAAAERDGQQSSKALRDYWHNEALAGTTARARNAHAVARRCRALCGGLDGRDVVRPYY